MNLVMVVVVAYYEIRKSENLKFCMYNTMSNHTVFTIMVFFLVDRRFNGNDDDDDDYDDDDDKYAMLASLFEKIALL
ncbi:hypothetical protein DERF_000016 [Dermatophagoides farinae]|uniref:Uncharacterized protein n=1 Tax=Dermatophagoides farinae TaxID=6954 RepID=A0A922I820_DERFA|nr:hypothetical protein DERF_000016 [Dermatophagoides farinae]